MSIYLKRAYEKAEESDAYRVLVDRLWPRGVAKESLKIDQWMKDIAPSDDLRRWFGHDPHKWDEFKERYFGELEENRDLLEELKRKVREGSITLVYAAKDEQYNNAVALKEYLERISA